MPTPSHDTFTDWDEEAGRDRRNVRWAVLAAVAVHALIFRIQLAETVAAEVRPPERPLWVLETPRFMPPPPREQKQLPEPRARRVPWPDPTPDDPEPLLDPTPRQVSLELSRADLVIGLPEAPPPALPELMRVGGEVRPPVKLHAPPPVYTEAARRARIEGLVQLEAVIDASGAVTRLRVVRSLPLGLDESAVEAVSGWRFEPATWRGKPVAVIYHLAINFKLD